MGLVLRGRPFCRFGVEPMKSFEKRMKRKPLQGLRENRSIPLKKSFQLAVKYVPLLFLYPACAFV